MRRGLGAALVGATVWALQIATASAQRSASTSDVPAGARWPASASAAGPVPPGPPLRVCFAGDSAPYSTVERGRPPAGFDVAVLRAAAARLGRALEPVMFETGYDTQGNLSVDARALLAAGVCELVAGVPLYAPQLAPMVAARARTPDYPGAAPLRQRPWQDLVPVAGGAPYRASALVLVARDDRDAAVADPSALSGRAVAVRAGSMASLAIGGWHGGAIAASIRGFNVKEDLLGALDAGKADFALVDIALWDRWRLAHPQSILRRAALDHPVKINIGLLARTSDEPLLRSVESALAEAGASGATAATAAATLTTWIAPVTPVVRPVLTVRDFS